jgi:hypothetical protein
MESILFGRYDRRDACNPIHRNNRYVEHRWALQANLVRSIRCAPPLDPRKTTRPLRLAQSAKSAGVCFGLKCFTRYSSLSNPSLIRTRKMNLNSIRRAASPLVECTRS